ncbi:hypothetical protein G9A89_004773 [Geosiphon pyriformis]|nr:hypothetical protein G9A89_004773 [Geosiphon pyriformis]
MQYILNIASEFFEINNILINNDKMVAISINQDIKTALLLINDLLILIAKRDKSYQYLGIFLLTKSLFKPSLVQAYMDIRFFSNVSFRAKAGLSCDFSSEILYHLFLYGLKLFEQVQSKEKLASLILFSNGHSIFGCLFDHRFLDLQILEWSSLNFLQFPAKLCLITTTSKVVIQTDSRTLEYYQSIYTHCKQRFNILDGIETFKKTLYQYIENRINNYLFGDYNISEVRHNLYESLIHHSRLNTQDFNSQTLETYFQELNFNIIQYCKENYPVEQKFSLSFELETEEGKGKRKQKLKTTPNTPKTTAKHLQTPEQGTSFKLPLLITPFPASLAQPQTPSSLLIQFSRIEDFQSPKSLIQQQEPILTSTNLIDYLTENQSEETESEQETEDSENEEEMASTYIAKIPEFTEEDSETISKAEDANGWNAARMLKAISYFLQKTAGEWFENLEFRNIKQEPSELVMTYFGKFNKLFRRICQLETNEYYSNAQILDQFIAELKDKLIKKVSPHAPEDLATAIQQAKNYEIAIEEANCTKLVNLAIGETSSAAEEKIDQLTKKVENYFTNQQQQQQPHNVAVNEQKAITAMYTEAEVEGKQICLILDSESAGSIITYQLIQQLQQTVDRPAQTVIVMTDGMKKTPVEEIDNFPFTIDGITIPIKVLVMDAPQYQALVGNNWFLKANANLDWETQELKILY